LKVLLLVPAPGNISPGQRFRFEHYIGLKNTSEVEFVIRPFFTKSAWGLLHVPGHLFQKVWGIFFGFLKRFIVLFTLYKYDCVYIYREVAPIGPPIFEWLIAKVFRKKIIYDFDDAIWVSIASEANPKVAAIKCSWKVADICRMSTIVTVGNQYLKDYAVNYCKDVRIIPTVVNTTDQHNRVKDQQTMPLVVGWTGTYTNFHNLEIITGVINELKKKYDFTFLIIANKDPKFRDVAYVYKPWKVETEIEDLLQMHIGVMPLYHREMELGKCGFKAIQYMSLGIPAIVSPVGVNSKVVGDETSGYLADSAQEWYDKLEHLLKHTELRTQMGAVARERIVQNYSVDATAQLFFDLFKKVS